MKGLTMTRDETLAAYEVNSHGVILTLGKFQGEMLYVPAMWEESGGGGCELDWPEGDTTYLVEITTEDRVTWPEISNDAVALHMAETDSGFVSCEALTAAELAELESRHDAAWQGDDLDGYAEHRAQGDEY